MNLTLALVLEIIYYVIALIVFILFRRKNIIITFNEKDIIITFNEKDITKRLNKHILFIQIVYSLAWPFTVIMDTINFIRGK